MITIKIAGLAIGIDNRFEYITRLAADYLTDEPPLFTVRATDDDIAEEAKMTDVKFPDGYLESIVAYRKIAEILPSYDAFVFHGAVLNYDGRAVAFTAKSGVGKTTHTRLWLSEFGEKVHYLNGDKPIIRFIDGVPYACGTPWRGKEGYGYNNMLPLGGIAFLARGPINRSYKAKPDDVSMRLMNQIYISKSNPLSIARSMRIADEILSSVPLYAFECNMDPEAAHVAYRAFCEGITTD